MAEVSAPTEAARWIVATLGADPTLTTLVGGRVYRELAPDGAVDPFVVFKLNSARNLRIVGPDRVWGDLRYLIHGTQAGSSQATLAPIYARVIQLLHAKRGATATATIDNCVHEADWQMTEIDTRSGQRYEHLGGFFQVKVAPLP